MIMRGGQNNMLGLCFPRGRRHQQHIIMYYRHYGFGQESLFSVPTKVLLSFFTSNVCFSTKASTPVRSFYFHGGASNRENQNSTTDANSANNANTTSWSNERRIRFSKLKPRESAALEDALLSRLNNSKDERLLDPILKTNISRKGQEYNDWIRSITVPSSSTTSTHTSFDNKSGNYMDDKHIESTTSTSASNTDSITVTIEPPTLLHPKLDDLASNIARFIQEETISLIQNHHPHIIILSDSSHAVREEDTHHSLVEQSSSSSSSSSLLPCHVNVTIRMSPRAAVTNSSTRPTIPLALPESQEGKKALQHITHFLAVYSCKGGVGKSTIATNLAYQLASSMSGARIGLLDLDVYGPSLPLLVRPNDATVRKSSPELGPNMIEPIEHEGVKLMSLGFVSPDSGVPGSGPAGGASVLRGPMAGRVVSQLLKGTNWGTLDVLILDLPPGTGDVQLEVCQSLSLSGAVAVSTPSTLAWSDVRKGVQMFGEMGVPTLALVENMAYFVCEGGGRHYPFGRSREKDDMNDNNDKMDMRSGNDDRSESDLTAHFLPNSSHVFHLPISSAVNLSNDTGSPLCLDDRERSSSGHDATEERMTFSKIAEAIATDLLLIQHGKVPLSRSKSSPNNSSGTNNYVLSVMIDEAGESEFDVSYTQLSVDNTNRNFTVRLFSNDGGYQKNISGNNLRLCNPANGEVDDASLAIPAIPRSGCSGESTRSSMVQNYSATDEMTSSLFPAKITKKGNYGYQVAWADGTTTIYSLLAISKAAGGKPIDRRIN